VEFVKTKRLSLWLVLAGILALIVLSTKLLSSKKNQEDPPPGVAAINERLEWHAPDSNRVPHTVEGDLIRYGKSLISNTSHYFGPKGSVAALSNGMNCQNCHLDAGARLYGNNYSAVFSTYPKFRERSGTVENIYKRVNDCFERSLHGKSLDTNSHEMQAIRAYIIWIGQNVPKNTKPAGAGITDLAFPGRAADTGNGHIVYVQQCLRCHGFYGEGLLNFDSTGYVYPPLWGRHSYTIAAGLFRLSRFAGYVKDNMPYGSSTHHSPQLTDEEAWNVAAFVNSRPRPELKMNKDWPDISGKPVDYPFGPYADSFPEKQHKYGPFGPIRLARQDASAYKNH